MYNILDEYFEDDNFMNNLVKISKKFNEYLLSNNKEDKLKV